MAGAAPAGNLHPITAAPELISRHGAFGCVVSFHSQDAQETGCAMKFVVYLPTESSKTLVLRIP
jgi:hypothetical protein